MNIPFKPLPSFEATLEERLARSKVAKEVVKKIRQEKEKHKLSPEQIEHWRSVLPIIVGPYAAMVMSDDEIQLMRDRLQKRIEQDQ